MEKTSVIEKLMLFGLSRQEANLYVCLHENGNLTGYEASKLTGISRSNVYGALNLLTEKGAAFMVEGNVTHYGAVDPEEFLDNCLRRLQAERHFLVSHMPKTLNSSDSYVTIQGVNNIKDKITHMLMGCEMRLYLAAACEIVEEYQEILAKMKAEGIKIVIISDKDFSEVATTAYLSKREEGQLRLITDSTYVLTGELWGQASDTCLYSGKENLVTVMKEALRNKIRLIEIEGTQKGEER